MTVKNICKVILFCICTLFCVKKVSEIVVPVEYSVNPVYEGGIESFATFYSEEKNSMDVIYLGSSHVYSGISPIQIYAKYGITGYNCATSNQNGFKSLHMLQEVLKRQSPKVVVMDLMSLMNPTITDEVSNWNMIGKMKFSMNFLKTAAHEGGKKDILSYMFPVLRYHERWEELEAVDFTNRFHHDYTKLEDMRYGDLVGVALTAEENLPFLQQAPTEELADLNEETAGYIREIKALCEKQGIQLVLVKTPVTGYTLEYANALRAFAEQEALPFLDYNMMYDEIGFDWQTDFLDTVHLNTLGRQKVSEHLGRYLSETCGIPGHTDETWEQDQLLYDREVKAKLLESISDPATWFTCASDGNYRIFVSGNILAMDADQLNLTGLSSVAVSPESPLVYAKAIPGTDAVEWRQDDAVKGTEDGCRYYTGPGEVNINNVSYAASEEGTCRVVVYDTVLQKIVDSVLVYGDHSIQRG